MKVAIVGNCQARPVGRYLNLMCPQIELLPATIVHLSTPTTYSDERSRLDEADLIFAQLVQDGYRADHLTTSALREHYSRKLFVWPNLFFTGSCPETTYITSKNNQRLRGPLDVYHHRYIFECWKTKIPIEEARDAIREMYSAQKSQLIASVEHSLSEFTARDEICHTNIADYIRTFWRDHRLFHTFNHPSAELLRAVSRQLAHVSGLPIEIELQGCFEHEPLNQIVPPTLNEVVDLLGIRYDAAESSMGIQCCIDGNVLTTSERRLYSLQELIDSFYQSYEAQNVGIETVRFTPAHSA